MWCRSSLKPNTKVIAWVAGIFEGEGNCSSPGGTFNANVTQKDPELLNILVAFFGGRIFLNQRGISKWYVSGPRAHGFMMTIYMFLTRRRQIQYRTAMQQSTFGG